MEKTEETIMEEIKAVKKETTLEKHIQTIMLSVITATIIGGFYKINSISESLVRMEERDKNKSDQISIMQISINTMQSDINALKERVTRSEVRKK